MVCGRVVVVLFLLDPGVGGSLDRDRARARRGLTISASLLDRERLGELVEHPELAALGRVLTGQLDAGQGVADVEHAPRLAALAVDGERVADDRLDAEAVEHGAEDAVVVEPGGQVGVQVGLLGLAGRRRCPG